MPEVRRGSSFTDEDFSRPDELDHLVWSVTPSPGATSVHMAVMWPRAKMVWPVVRDLAARHGLACYDPQADEVCNPPMPG